MKDLALGCLGAILGLVVGIALTFGVMSLLPKTDSAEKVAAVVGASRGDVTITVSAKYLNAQLQQIVKQTGAAKQATLTLVAPNLAQINAVIETKILGQAVAGSVLARLRVSVQSGCVALAVEKIDVSGIGISPTLVAPLVEQVRAQAEEQINKVIQRELQGTGLRLSNIRVAPGEVAVDLTAQ
jgi:hypothetical protein